MSKDEIDREINASRLSSIDCTVGLLETLIANSDFWGRGLIKSSTNEEKPKQDNIKDTTKKMETESDAKFVFNLKTIQTK